MRQFIKILIKCDNCDRDLTEANSIHDYSLILKCLNISINDDYATMDIYIIPHIKQFALNRDVVSIDIGTPSDTEKQLD